MRVDLSPQLGGTHSGQINPHYIYIFISPEGSKYNAHNLQN